MGLQFCSTSVFIRRIMTVVTHSCIERKPGKHLEKPVTQLPGIESYGKLTMLHFGLSHPKSCEKINLPCLNYPICIILLQPSKKTKTNIEAFGKASTGSRCHEDCRAQHTQLFQKKPQLQASLLGSKSYEPRFFSPFPNYNKKK